MIYIKELHDGNTIYYDLEITNNEETISHKTIYYRSTIKEKDGFAYLMLYDLDMAPLKNVFDFLNYGISSQSINSRIKALQALKLLYYYQTIISKEICDFSLADINGLKFFLKGLSSHGQNISFDLLTSRSNETINGYLSVYRQFLVYSGKENKTLNAQSAKTTTISLPDTDADYKVNKYVTNEKLPKKVIEVPRYISVPEFQNIITTIRNFYTNREEIIVRLMFQCGLRIGECLGITADDLVMEKIDNIYCPVLYIRNRKTDKPYQYAKTCMKITDIKQYNSKEYKTSGYGYQKIVLPEDLYDLINNYIESAHTSARETKHDNYYNSTIADRVRQSEEYEDDNYYIFLNSLGRPLSATSWNNIIREIFIKCGIPVDNDVREHNLNHRFRHGFAMFNIQYLNCKEIELKERMRHSSLQSVTCYFRPTISDAIKVKTDFTKSLYDIIPELKEGGI